MSAHVETLKRAARLLREIVDPAKTDHYTYEATLRRPEVASAMADLFETAAFVAEGNGLVDDDRYKDEYRLACVILREVSDGG